MGGGICTDEEKRQAKEKRHHPVMAAPPDWGDWFPEPKMWPVLSCGSTSTISPRVTLGALATRARLWNIPGKEGVDGCPQPGAHCSLLGPCGGHQGERER